MGGPRLMAKFQSPLLGYNNNVRHKNRIFHIQTEDSGVNHPHIITHLFMDGGRILKSVKKSYAEHVGTDGMSETVRGMMKEQHKAMFIALRDGQFDELVDGSLAAKAAPVSSQEKPASAPSAAAAAAAPAPVAAPVAPAPAAVPAPAPAAAPASVAAAPPVAASPTGPAPAPVAAPASVAPAPPVAASPTGPAPPRPSAAPPPVSQPISRTEPRTEREPSPPPLSATEAKPRPAVPSNREARLLLAESEVPDPPTTTRQERAPTSEELTLDFDALERAQENPAVTSSAGSLFQAAELPPPPKNLFAKELGTGAYRAVEPEGSRRPPAPTPAGASARPRPSGGRPNEGRYAPARPAAIFGSAPKPATSAPPTAPTPSIFSDDLISDKSLDEVILSYLAEDLEPPRRK